MKQLTEWQSPPQTSHESTQIPSHLPVATSTKQASIKTGTRSVKRCPPNRIFWLKSNTFIPLSRKLEISLTRLRILVDHTRPVHTHLIPNFAPLNRRYWRPPHNKPSIHLSSTKWYDETPIKCPMNHARVLANDSVLIKNSFFFLQVIQLIHLL